MNKLLTRGIAIRLLIFIAVVIGLVLVLSTKYVTVGQCAVTTYYKPIDVWDILLFSVITGAGFFISAYAIGRPNLKERAIMAVLYGVLLCLVSLFGNDLLGSRTIDWPQEYKVQSITESCVSN